MAVPRCPRCGHNFYNDSPNKDGFCTWCQDEIDNPEYCHVCSKVATCTGQMGYLCNASKCAKIDELVAQIEYIKKHE